jgi:hypothetical protein
MTKDKSRGARRFGNLVQIAVPVDKKNRPAFHFDLTEQEFGVIGLVVVHGHFWNPLSLSR